MEMKWRKQPREPPGGLLSAGQRKAINYGLKNSWTLSTVYGTMWPSSGVDKRKLFYLGKYPGRYRLRHRTFVSDPGRHSLSDKYSE